MSFEWPDGKRCAVVFSFDVDAESAFLYLQPDRAQVSLAEFEERRYGPRHGVSNLVQLLNKHGIKGTFFIPGWTAINHRDACELIRDAGHEIGAHGVDHESPLDLTSDEEARVLVRSLEILQSQLGVRPVGYRAPYWDVSHNTGKVLAELGMLYDSSLMGSHQPYRLAAEKGAIIEIPVHWTLSDAVVFRHVHGQTSDVRSCKEVSIQWREEFDAYYESGACYVLTCHPWLSGRLSRIAMLDSLIGYMKQHDGVWFATAEDVARWTESL